MTIEIYKIIKSKRRTLGIEITNSGELIIRTPKNISQDTINKIINQKLEWIKKKQTLVKRRNAELKTANSSKNNKFLILGKHYNLSINNLDKSILEKFYKKNAKNVFLQRINLNSQNLNLPYSKMTISNAKKQWGSCNHKNNISISWRLIMAPIEIIDYVIIHELYHTKIKNHSKKFWESIEKIIPDYKQKRKWLKNNAHILNL